jgi:pilus assembly protein CpaF
MKQIRVVDNVGGEYFFPVEQAVAEISIGRSQSNDIILGSTTVSRHHAKIKIMGDRVLLVNQSANGVMVGAERVDKVYELSPGEEASIDVYRVSVIGGQVRADVDELKAHSTIMPEGGLAAIQAIKQKTASESGEVDMDAFLGVVAPAKDFSEPRISLSGKESVVVEPERRAALVAFKSGMHDELKERLDLHSFQISDYADPRVVRNISEKLKELLTQREADVPPPYTKDDVFKELMDEVCGLGPIEDLLKHRKVTEVMVVDRTHIYAEMSGQLVLTDRFFSDAKSMMTVIERIVIPRGRRIDESSPLVDTRLADGSRVNAVIPPLALKDPCITIRKFPEDRLGIGDLVRFGSMTPDMAKFLGRSVRVRKNIIISGGTGSGKTTLLNVMSSFIGLEERVVTIEDAAELQLQQAHVVSLETKPPNLEGKGEVSIRDLVKNALRMRPDRIVVGECRGGETLDMLQAMNTGHDGSMTTVHSNSPIEAISRIETLVLMSGMDLPTRAIREQIANSVDVIVQQTRFSDGSRRITYISEIVGINDDGLVEIEDVYRYRQTGMNEEHKVQGYHMATGYLPSFLNDFLVQGLASPEDFF